MCTFTLKLHFTISLIFVFLFVCGEASIEKKSNVRKSEMSKLTITYQNLGLGDRVTRKFHEIECILKTRKPHLLFISETRIDVDAVTQMEALDYSIETMLVTSERIWCAVQNTVNYKRLTNYELADFPAIWIQVGSGKSAYIVVGLYREFTRLDNVKPSRTLGQQRDRFSRFLDKVYEANKTGKEIHLLGDFNLNVKRWIQNGNRAPGWKFQSLVDELYEKVLNHGFVRTVDQITRISGKVESVLDLHLTNRPEKVGKVLLTGDTKSDHLTLTMIRSKPDQVAPPVYEGRSWKKVNWVLLKQLVYRHHMETLRGICMIRDANEIANRFTAWANVLLDDKTPVTRSEFKNNYTPWMTKPLLELIKEKNLLLKKFQRTGLETHRVAWVKLKTKVSNNCRDAQHAYWKEELKDGVESRALWKSSKRFVGQKSPGAPSQIVYEGKILNDPADVANGCQDAILGKVDKIMNDIPVTHKDPLDYTRDYVASKNKCTFTFPTCNLTRGVGYREVKRAIKGLKYTDAEGHDHLSTRFIKTLSKPLLHVLTCICNRSFEQETYPDVYQLARVCLLCKDVKQKMIPVKYRPVSVLPAPSKVLEKVVINRVNDHMERNDLYPDQQHGYRNHRSCSTAVISMQDNILRDLENGIDSIVVFCDLSSAFDTLSHKNILGKLRVYGFTESSVRWYESYLKHRAQFVSVAGAHSRQRRIHRGLPQGSLSGSTIFGLVYGDVVIVQISENVFMILYADDLSLKMRLCGNVQVDELLVNRQMAAIQVWMNSNQLVFNPDKTEVLIVKKSKGDIYKDFKLTMGDTQITPKAACRMLGLQLTKNLRQDWYINQMPGNLMSSLNHRMHVLGKLRTSCGPKQYQQLAYGLIFSKVSYGVQLYSQCTEKLKNEIRLVLNRCVRLATYSKLSDRRRTISMYQELKFLTFDSICASQDLNLLWNIMAFNTPQYLARGIGQPTQPRQGAVTRSQVRSHRLVLNKDNQGLYTQRREAFLSRALRRFDHMLTKEYAFYREMTMEMNMTVRKKMLKEHFLKKDFDGTT